MRPLGIKMGFGVKVSASLTILQGCYGTYRNTP
jgi:hypothetical protein